MNYKVKVKKAVSLLLLRNRETGKYQVIEMEKYKQLREWAFSD